MPRKTGQSRIQFGLFATPLEEMIADDNTVRVIDAYVDSLDLEKLGFKAVRENNMGASSYAPSVLLKIYFYGYFNRIRSSRKLMLECERNVEMMWLTNLQTPSYHTISTFRTYQEKDPKGKITYNHRTALVAVFRTFNKFLDQLGLFGKELFAVDGTKIAAQNSKKRHITEEKLKRKLDRVNQRIEEYLNELDNEDQESDLNDVPKAAIQKALAELNNRKNDLLYDQKLLKTAQAEDPRITQICLTDPDARMLPTNNEGMMQIAYNVQAAVDDKHCLIADMRIRM
jgi:transposase